MTAIVRKMADTFMYFAFGSNLLRERILINNPSAEFLTIAKLKDYRLGFGVTKGYRNWQGGTATIISSAGEHVWGCVWRLGDKDMPNLDRQEGVSLGEYKPLTVEVESEGGDTMSCRCYHLDSVNEGDPRPSPQYLSVIQRGGHQNDLPEYYQLQLANIEHNGFQGHLKVMDDIEKMIQKLSTKDAV